jgi:hypothetical protein
MTAEILESCSPATDVFSLRSLYSGNQSCYSFNKLSWIFSLIISGLFYAVIRRFVAGVVLVQAIQVIPHDGRMKTRRHEGWKEWMLAFFLCLC